MPVLDPSALIDDRVAAIRRLHQESGLARAQLDVSGGIDSAVMAALLARALDPAQVITVHSSIDSDPAALERAREVTRACGLALCEIELSDLFHSLADSIRESMVAAGHDRARLERRLEQQPMVLGSVRSTLRAPVGRAFNRFFGGGIRHGTGNECEDRWLRFYQKGGDGEVDTNPLAMLAKGEVYQLAHALGVPDSLIAALPTPDLWARGDAHDDEGEIAAQVGVDPAPHKYYGAIDRGTGAYVRVGLIERVCRFDDATGGELFRDHADEAALVLRALESAAFSGVEASQIEALVPAVRRVERSTRHKLNPAIPTLGSRAELLARGILTNDLAL